jgi:hypothetical protein
MPDEDEHCKDAAGRNAEKTGKKVRPSFCYYER